MIDSGELRDLVEVAGGACPAGVELAPYAADDHDWFVASDWSSRRTGRPTAADHVLGVGGASTMLAQCTVRAGGRSRARPGHRLRGAGLPSRPARRRVWWPPTSATRCLELAAFNAAMNGVRLDLRRGSLFEPVADERFDLVVSNPPFVIGSPAAARHDYRDSGMEGTASARAVVTRRRRSPHRWRLVPAARELGDHRRRRLGCRTRGSGCAEPGWTRGSSSATCRTLLPTSRPGCGTPGSSSPAATGRSTTRGWRPSSGEACSVSGSA